VLLDHNHHPLFLPHLLLRLLLSQNEDMLGRSPEAVAEFLAKTEGLNKTLIGECSTQHITFCQQACWLSSPPLLLCLACTHHMPHVSAAHTQLLVACKLHKVTNSSLLLARRRLPW
jgi:hypothetical protein